MEKKKNNASLIFTVAGILVAIILLVIFVKMATTSKVTCTFNKDLLTGFENTEEVVFKLKSNKISSISLEKTIKIGDYYSSSSYRESVETLLKNGYSYIDGKVTTGDKSVTVKAKTKKSGIILDNVKIMKNSETEDTSLRYDILTDLENEKNVYKVNDQYTKKELKEAITKIGYSCK